MTGFIDTQERANLSRDLGTVARLEPELLRIARREVSPPGGRAARRPTVPGSTPPVNLGALDAARDIRAGMLELVGALHRDTGVVPPGDQSVPKLATHLRRHAAALAGCDWSVDACDRVRGYARQLRYAVDPPDARYLGPCQADGPPACRGLFSGDGRDGHCGKCDVTFDVAAVEAATEERKRSAYRDQNGTPMEVAVILSDLGYRIDGKRITNKQVTYWGKAGRLTSRGQVVDGPRVSPLFNVGEVVDVAGSLGAQRADDSP